MNLHYWIFWFGITSGAALARTLIHISYPQSKRSSLPTRQQYSITMCILAAKHAWSQERSIQEASSMRERRPGSSENPHVPFRSMTCAASQIVIVCRPNDGSTRKPNTSRPSPVPPRRCLKAASCWVVIVTMTARLSNSRMTMTLPEKRERGPYASRQKPVKVPRDGMLGVYGGVFSLRLQFVRNRQLNSALPLYYELLRIGA